MTIEQVAAELECSVSKVSRIETGQVGVTPRDVRDMVELYHLEVARRDELVQLARDAREKGWWVGFEGNVERIDKLVGLETEASEICEFEALVVPGLLQTADYARATIRAFYPEMDDRVVEQNVALRRARQELLALSPRPIFNAIVDEGVLRRPVGGADVMRAQLEHLIDRSGWPNVSLQVLPFERGEHGVVNGFTILSFAETADLDVVYVESEAADLYLDAPDQLKRYLERFELLRSKALDCADSVKVLSELLR